MDINSVEEYWNKLIVPDARMFRSQPSPNSVFHAAVSVWHFHDWVWHDRNPGQNSGGPRFEAYRSKLLAGCPELGWLRDVADASKHRGLGRLPTVKGAEPQLFRNTSGLVTLGVGGTIMGPIYFLVLNDGSKQNFDGVLTAALNYWQTDLKNKNLPVA